MSKKKLRKQVKALKRRGTWFYFQATKKLQKYLPEQKKTEHGRKATFKK